MMSKIFIILELIFMAMMAECLFVSYRPLTGFTYGCCALSIMVASSFFKKRG